MREYFNAEEREDHIKVTSCQYYVKKLAQSIMLAIQDKIVDKLIYTISNLIDDNIKMFNYISKEANKKNIEPFEEFNTRSKK